MLRSCRVSKLLTSIVVGAISLGFVLGASSGAALAQAQKPNIVLIVSDDFGYGDAGPYGGGPGRGMPTPNLDRIGGGDDLLHLLRPAELHARPRGDADRSLPEPQRHDHGRLPGAGRRTAEGGVDARRRV